MISIEDMICVIFWITAINLFVTLRCMPDIWTIKHEVKKHRGKEKEND